MSELVSIIVPSYNSENFIGMTIDAVLSQTYDNWEMIVVDDFSVDSTIDIVSRYLKNDKRIKLILLDKNCGPAMARNRGIEESRGRYIAFLDSDDYWEKDKLQKQLHFMKKNNAGLSFTGYYHVEETSGKRIKQVKAPKKINYQELLKKNIIGCLTAMYDTQLLGKIYMSNIQKRQDYALWLTILKKIPYAYGLDEPLGYYRVRKNSLSSNKILSSKYNWILYREVEKLPLYKAIYYFGWYTYRSFLKYK